MRMIGALTARRRSCEATLGQLVREGSALQGALCTPPLLCCNDMMSARRTAAAAARAEGRGTHMAVCTIRLRSDRAASDCAATNCLAIERYNSGTSCNLEYKTV